MLNISHFRQLWCISSNILISSFRIIKVWFMYSIQCRCIELEASLVLSLLCLISIYLYLPSFCCRLSFICSSLSYLFVCSWSISHSFICSFVPLFVHAFICVFVRSFVRSFIHSFICSSVWSLIKMFCSLVYFFSLNLY